MRYYLKLLLLILSISYIFGEGEAGTGTGTGSESGTGSGSGTGTGTGTAKALGESCTAGTDTCVDNAQCVKASEDATGTTCNCKSGYTKSGTSCVASSNNDPEDDSSSFIKISLFSLLALLF